MSNFQRSLIWKCYRGALPVWDKSTEVPSAEPLGGVTTTMKSFCTPSSSAQVLMSCGLCRANSITCRTDTTVSISPPPFVWPRGADTICIVAVARKVVWWTDLKELKIDSFLFGQRGKYLILAFVIVYWCMHRNQWYQKHCKRNC